MVILCCLGMGGSGVAAAPISDRIVARNPGIWVTPPSNGLPYLVLSQFLRLELTCATGTVGNSHLRPHYRHLTPHVPVSSETRTLSSVRPEKRKHQCTDRKFRRQYQITKTRCMESTTAGRGFARLHNGSKWWRNESRNRQKAIG
jgi:hypothetical protein